MPIKLKYNQVINKFQEIHKNKYDYSKIKYINNTTKVEIICIKHGSFKQRPSDHIQGHGCPKCGGCGKYFNGNEYFIKRSQEIHENKYDYSLVEYKTAKIKVKIICPEHGEFVQTPNNHLQGQGCIRCRNNFISKNNKFDSNIIIENLNKIHGNKYSYPESINSLGGGKIKIICPKHGLFEQNIINHYYNKNGCEKCGNNRLSKGETQIEIFLKENNINHMREYKFEKCINPKTNKKLPFDFYLPDFNLCIEFDGFQHFNEAPWFKIGPEELKEIKYKDNIKNKYCDKNNIKLIRISYIDFKEIKNTLSCLLK